MLITKYGPVKAEMLYGPCETRTNFLGSCDMNDGLVRDCFLNEVFNPKKLNLEWTCHKAMLALDMPFYNENVKNYSFYGKTTDGRYYFEYWDMPYSNYVGEDDYGNDDKIQILIDKMGIWKAQKVNSNGDKQPVALNCEENKYVKNKHSASCFIFALLAKFYLDSQIELAINGAKIKLKSHIDALLETHKDADEQGFIKAWRVLNNDLYALCSADFVDKIVDNPLDVNKHYKQLVKPIFPIKDEEIPSLKEMEIYYGSSNIVDQDPQLRSEKATSATTKAKSVKELLNENPDEYKLNPSRVLTEEEMKLVPHKDNFIPSKEVLNKIKLIKASTKNPNPFRNILWTGETGAGKSTSCAIAAQMLGLPYVYITCNADMSINDLVEDILPNTKTSNLDLPSFEDIEFDPGMAYMRITGNVKEDATEDDCLKAIAAAADDKRQFVAVKSQLIKAVESGWFVEIQEANLLTKPGVLGGLNALLDDAGTIHMPTGETIKRHPDTVIAMTANVGYEGTRPLNQAVKSRLSLKGEFSLPSDEELVDIIKARTGYFNSAVIMKMIKCMYAVRNVLEENGADDGSFGLREILAWAGATNCYSEFIDSALEAAAQGAKDTFLMGTTYDKDVLACVIQALQTHGIPVEY